MAIYMKDNLRIIKDMVSVNIMILSKTLLQKDNGRITNSMEKLLSNIPQKVIIQGILWMI
jgi:hypothetical protein